MEQITAVVVVYKEVPAESKIFRSILSLCKTNTEIRELLKMVNFVIYDNSPKRHDIGQLKNVLPNITYYHDKTNSGLSSAYNYALSIAENISSDYLWLFDQDTYLNENYMAELIKLLHKTSATPAAIVPNIFSDGILISPRSISSPFKVEAVGNGMQDRVLAINSASLINVEFLSSIGGFSSEFPLDFLDNWLFYQIHKSNLLVYVMSSRVEHNLSVLDTKSISPDRYRSIIISEKRYYTEYQLIGKLRYKWHIILRIGSQLVVKRDITKARLLIKYCLFN